VSGLSGFQKDVTAASLKIIDTKSEVLIQDDLCGAILEYVYAAPHRVAKVAKE
jgi:hypothetical protein